MAGGKDESDAVSLNTLVDYATDRARADAPPSYRDAVPYARREQSPSRSSFFSSTAGSVWTPESVSDFSEQQALLDGASTPPPGYPEPRRSIALSVGSLDPLDEDVGALLLETPPENASDDPRKGRGYSSRDKKYCGYSRKDWSKARAIISVLFVCFLVGFSLGFIVTRKSSHNHASSHLDRPVPTWAQEDCSKFDDKYNHYEFNDIHDLEIADGQHGSFKGNVRVLPPLAGQTADLIMKQLAKKTKSLDIKINGRQSAQAAVPRSSPPSLEKRGSCKAEVLLHFRDGLIIENFVMRTHAGHIQVFSPLIVNGTTTITTKSGRINADSFFNTRRTYIQSGSSSLQGHFKLYDLLSITSTSGVIDVTVEPQEADEKSPKPAELIISSQSGRVQLSTTRVVPARDYVTTVESRDGRIEGTILHGSKTFIKSQSGQLNLDILPYGTVSSNLYTSSQSGRQNINVLSPLPSANQEKTKVLGHMQSTHQSQSGALQLRYPAEWAGKIDGSTSSGAIGVTGGGVQIIEKGAHYVKALKAEDEGSSMLTFRAQSGSARLAFDGGW